VDLLDLILGRRRRRDSDLSGVLGFVSRWLAACSCLIVSAIVLLIVLIAGGVIAVGGDTVTLVIVFVTIIVAVASLIRTSMGQ
jgi:peptidoglycan/LPS O-acetylase OafA/YrhL